MNKTINSLLISALFILCSCDETAIRNATQQQNRNTLGAEEIDIDLGGKCYPNSAGTEYNCVKTPYTSVNNDADKVVYNKKTYIAWLVSDSQKKCDYFVKRLSTSENNPNGSGINNVANAIGTAFPQVGAINTVANASGISVMNNNSEPETYYARKNIANYIQAINLSYGIKIKKYIDNLEAKDENKINPAIEINNLRIIHGLCSLNSAQSFISEKLNDNKTNDTYNSQQAVKVMNNNVNNDNAQQTTPGKEEVAKPETENK